MTNSRDAFTATDVHASNAAPLVGGVRQPPWLPVDFVDRCGCGRRRLTGPAGVRENRGAGAACWTPWAVITVDRAFK